MRFLVSVTYSETTPESTEHGDFSETGFESEDQVYTLRELISLIKSDGYYREGGTTWMTTGFHTVCYRTATDREYNLHVELICPKTIGAYQRRLYDQLVELLSLKQYKPLMFGDMAFASKAARAKKVSKSKKVHELADRILALQSMLEVA